ncbi:hypothetical protein [Neobacillus sp. D3-1R]|uniref:hypothetical protein n=1 Tax=Neobacillus sp. D3-1R TaxID=3445778 RepID=UPI003FA0B484
MAKMIFKDEKSLQSIDEVFRFASQALGTNRPVFLDGKTIPPAIGIALGGTIGAGIGVAGLGAGVAGVAGTASFIGGASAAIGTAALLPFVAPVAILSGIGYFIFKGKRQKDLHRKKLTRYKEAISKQNDVIKKYQEIDKQRVESEEKLNKVNEELRAKINELLAINEALLKIISELGSDLQVA